MAKKPQYVPFGRFVLRTPLFPLEAVRDREALVGSDLFREALYLASPGLLEGNSSGRPGKQTKYEDSLLKYFHRACTRCTPFGLFAGCSVGRLAGDTCLRLADRSEYRRTTRLDMQYLCALIQEVERMAEVRRNLLFYPNDTLYRIGGRLRYVEYRYKGAQRMHRLSSVEDSEPLRAVLGAAAGGASPGSLAALLVDDEISPDDAAEFIEELIDSQILKSELEPAVVGPDVLERMLERLSALDCPSVAGPLGEVRELLSRIDASAPGGSLPLYTAAADRIKTIGVGYEAKYLFQADMFKPLRDDRIDSRFCDRLSELLAFLARITPPYSSPRAGALRDAFTARYEQREVPLSEVLDNDLGLGYPAGSGSGPDGLVAGLAVPPKPSPSAAPAYGLVDTVLLRKLAECLRSGGDCIELTDDDFKGVEYRGKLPDTFGVMCSLLGPDPADCEVLIRSIGGSTAASLLGRFCHIDSRVESLVREICSAEAAMHPDKIVAEISHLPESRIGNIASRPALRDYAIHYLSAPAPGVGDIPVSDLLLSVKGGRLVLRSKKYGKEVIPRLTCAHNYSLSPIPAYLFLCELQNQDNLPGLFLRWPDFLQRLDYLPRVRYKGFILCRRRWVVNLDDEPSLSAADKEGAQPAVAALAAVRGLPRYVVVPDADNEMYLDLEDPCCARMFLALLRKRKRVELEEFVFDQGGSPVTDGDKAYANQMIFAFKRSE